MIIRHSIDVPERQSATEHSRVDVSHANRKTCRIAIIYRVLSSNWISHVCAFLRDLRWHRYRTPVPEIAVESRQDTLVTFDKKYRVRKIVFWNQNRNFYFVEDKIYFRDLRESYFPLSVIRVKERKLKTFVKLVHCVCVESRGRQTFVWKKCLQLFEFVLTSNSLSCV